MDHIIMIELADQRPGTEIVTGIVGLLLPAVLMYIVERNELGRLFDNRLLVRYRAGLRCCGTRCRYSSSL